MQEYETNVDKYNGALEDAGTPVAKKPRLLTLSDAVQKEVTFKYVYNIICSIKKKINANDGFLIIGKGSGESLR